LLVVYTDKGLFVRLLEWPPVRYLGRVSYGLYLYHWPVLIAVQMISAHPEFSILGHPTIKCPYGRPIDDYRCDLIF
jgi:peptidoglycan/LPS O-acetylase OafA/YrhL